MHFRHCVRATHARTHSTAHTAPCHSKLKSPLSSLCSQNNKGLNTWLTAYFFGRYIYIFLLLTKVWGREKEKQAGRDIANKTLFVSTPKLCLSIPIFQLPLFSLLFYCAHPAIQHLSLPGWMNSSIQKDYYAERKTEGGMGQRARRRRRRRKMGGGGGVIYAEHFARLRSQPFNSLSSEFKSLTCKTDE